MYGHNVLAIFKKKSAPTGACKCNFPPITDQPTEGHEGLLESYTFQVSDNEKIVLTIYVVL